MCFFISSFNLLCLRICVLVLITFQFVVFFYQLRSVLLLKNSPAKNKFTIHEYSLLYIKLFISFVKCCLPTLICFRGKKYKSQVDAFLLLSVFISRLYSFQRIHNIFTSLASLSQTQTISSLQII